MFDISERLRTSLLVSFDVEDLAEFGLLETDKPFSFFSIINTCLPSVEQGGGDNDAETIIFLRRESQL